MTEEARDPAEEADGRWRLPCPSVVPAALVLALALAAGALGPVPLGAQQAGDEGSPLFGARDAWIASAYLGAAALSFPFDRAIAAEVQDSLFQHRPGLQRASRAFDLLGVPGAFLLSGGLYGVGRLLDHRSLSDTGLHAAEAFVLAEVVTFAIKLTAGRSRPRRNVEDPFDFVPFRGFIGDDWQAFPSGHSAGAFAVAGALAHEMEHHWGGSPWLYGLTYVPASLVAISRMYDNHHWTSDVVFGAAIGAFSGWKVVKYSHDNPDNRLDRWFLSAYLTPGVPGSLRLAVVPGR